MKSAIQVVLADPAAASRTALEGLLNEVGAAGAVRTCDNYAEIRRTVGESRARLLVVVLDSDIGTALGQLQIVAREHPGVALLPASKARDGDLILRAIRAGAREFLTLPATAEDLVGAIDRLVHIGAEAEGAAPPPPAGGNLIAVAGATGGVGCTTLAVNLATQLAKNPDQSVALADFDLLFGAVDACLDVAPDQTLLEISQNVDRLDLTLLRRALAKHPSGVHVLARPAAMEDVSRVESEAVRRVLTTLRSGFSAIVVDTSKGLMGTDLTAFEMADSVLLVVQLDIVCLRNTARLLQLFRQHDGFDEKIRIVANRTGSHHCEISLHKAEETLKHPISWHLPNAAKEFAAARSRGVPLSEAAPGVRAHRAIMEIAHAYARPVLNKSANPPAKEKRGIGRIAAMFF